MENDLSQLFPLGFSNHPLERRATVIQMIRPGAIGLVSFLGSIWTAYCEQKIPLNAGCSVWVVKRIHNTLIVKPEQ